MPIGAAKLGVLGAGLVPGGTETFNAPGTFSIPPGVKKVSITGVGGAGNPGTSGTAGNPGNSGNGGGGGGGTNQRSGGVAFNAGLINEINNFPGTAPFGPGWPFSCYITPPGQAYSLCGVESNGWRFPGSPCFPRSNFCNQVAPRVVRGAYLITPIQGSAPPNFQQVNGQSGNSGTGGSGGAAGNPGNPGQPSSGLGNTFPGGAAGNAGNAGAAGNGGSGGNVGAVNVGPGGPLPNNNPYPSKPLPGGAGGNGGGAGAPSAFGCISPCTTQFAAMIGSGGGGAGVTNDGKSGAQGGPTSNIPFCTGQQTIGSANMPANVSQGGTDSSPCVPTLSPFPLPYPPGRSVGTTPPATPANTTGGGGGGSKLGYVGGAPVVASYKSFIYGLPDGNTPISPNPCGVSAVNTLKNMSRFNNTPSNSNLYRAGGGGASSNPGISLGAGGGGGRGNAGNPGGAGGAGGTGGAGAPQTFNCVPVTPGGTAPITVGSPGGQIVISWNPQ